MKKLFFTGGSITIYPDSLHIEQKALFAAKKTATVPFSEIKTISAPFDRLNIETSNARFSLWFVDHMRAFMAHNAVRAAMKDAGF